MVFLIEREVGPEKKIADRVLVKDAMDEKSVSMAFKIDAIILGTVAMKRSPIARDFAKHLTVDRIQIAWQELEFRQ